MSNLTIQKDLPPSDTHGVDWHPLLHKRNY